MCLHTLKLERHNYTKSDLLTPQVSHYVEYSSVENVSYFIYERPNRINFLTVDFQEFQL